MSTPGELCSANGQCDSNICSGSCLDRQAEIAKCVPWCKSDMHAAEECQGHTLANLDKSCTEICGKYVDNKYIDKMDCGEQNAVLNFVGNCFQGGDNHCYLRYGTCSFHSTTSCD